MKTTTIRLEDHWADQVELAANLKEVRPSDVLRDAVRYYMTYLASKDDPVGQKLAEFREEVQKQAIEKASAPIKQDFDVQV